METQSDDAKHTCGAVRTQGRGLCQRRVLLAGTHCEAHSNRAEEVTIEDISQTLATLHKRASECFVAAARVKSVDDMITLERHGMRLLREFMNIVKGGGVTFDMSKDGDDEH